jgi:hypothetical protein
MAGPPVSTDGTGPCAEAARGRRRAGVNTESAFGVSRQTSFARVALGLMPSKQPDAMLGSSGGTAFSAQIYLYKYLGAGDRAGVQRTAGVPATRCAKQ